MNPFRFLALAPIALVAACAAEPGPNDPTNEESNALVTKNACTQEKTSDACLKAAGGVCAWGDRGAGHECFYVGKIVPQPAGSGAACSSGSQGPSEPSVCSRDTEASCLGEHGCAWGDKGHGPECFYIGEVVPQAW